MSLANINPGDVIQVQMTYTELLVPEGGVYEFVFPNIVGPRFTDGEEEWVIESIGDSWSLADTEINIDAKINAGMLVVAENPSHGGVISYDGNTVSTAISTTPITDYVLKYNLDGNEIETGLLLYEGAEENFFLSIIQPPKPDVVFNPPAREYVFIIDISGSMNGTPLDISKDLLINLLADLNMSDRFNIVFFAGGSSVYAPNSLPVTQE